MLTALAVGYWLSVFILAACFLVVAGLLIDVSACRSVAGTHVWWTISREKAGAKATQYRRLVQLREMVWDEAFAAYKADVGSLHLSDRWAPPAIGVLDEYCAIDREHRKADWRRRFNEPWPFEDAR